MLELLKARNEQMQKWKDRINNFDLCECVPEGELLWMGRATLYHQGRVTDCDDVKEIERRLEDRMKIAELMMEAEPRINADEATRRKIYNASRIERGAYFECRLIQDMLRGWKSATYDEIGTLINASKPL